VLSLVQLAVLAFVVVPMLVVASLVCMVVLAAAYGKAAVVVEASDIVGAAFAGFVVALHAACSCL
jgi:hypothetical protein